MSTLNSNYIKKFEDKYLVSGPAPLGRILNYVKRIKLGQYTSSIRGPRISDQNNLDDWTICFMVGLEIIKIPTRMPTLQIKLTDRGEKIYSLIKNLVNFIDQPAKSKVDMQIIKQQLRQDHPEIYQFLKNVFLNSVALKNLAIFLRKNNIYKIDRQKFYKDYGKIFNISEAGFNRLPSLIQIAEFCDILIEDGKIIRVYDIDYINDFIVSESNKAIKNIVKQNAQQGKKEKKELDSDEKEILEDLSEKILPEKEKRIIFLFKRNVKISKKLKELYQGKCQICGFTFEKRNGQNYSESHHVIPLGEKGSENIQNIIIICPNCHSQIHYDKTKWKNFGDNIRYVELNGKLKEVKYKPIHFQAAIKEI